MQHEKKNLNVLQTRIAPRKECGVSGLYKILDRNRFFARSYLGIKSPMVLIDISTTGIAFKVDNVIPKGSYLEIELNKLSEEHIFRTPVTVACEAVYCRYLDLSTSRIGAKFLEIDRNDVEKIRTFTE